MTSEDTPMHTYRLHYLADQDDADPRHYTSTHPVKPGDVLQLPETGMFHLVAGHQVQKTGIRLDLSKSATNEADARLLAAQYRHWSAA